MAWIGRAKIESRPIKMANAIPVNKKMHFFENRNYVPTFSKLGGVRIGKMPKKSDMSNAKF